jgi:hypothetical protein
MCKSTSDHGGQSWKIRWLLFSRAGSCTVALLGLDDRLVLDTFSLVPIRGVVTWT